jgi:septum formation protein
MPGGAGRVILASASPRRRDLVSLIIDRFDVVPSDFDEDSVPGGLDPPRHVVYSAEMKALKTASSRPGALVIAADTVVVIDGRILGKPADEDDAARMLRLLSGRTHQVYTGVAVARDGVLRSDFECTQVTFRRLSEDLIARYVASGEPMDKAGAYAIQGKGGVLITGIRGCWFNVVGLPLYKLSRLLEEFGIEPLST